jgi:hypothetical protein
MKVQQEKNKVVKERSKKISVWKRVYLLTATDAPCLDEEI